MRDEIGPRDEKRARGAARRRRAQMRLAQLRWLEGFEADGRWWVVGGEPKQLAVDGLAIARAQRTINTLRRDHGGDLPHLLADPDAWFAAADGVLRNLGERAHGRTPSADWNDPLPPRLRRAARALASAHPDLRPLVRAAISTWTLRPDVLAAAIAWMRPRARDLTALIDGVTPAALRRALSLALVAADDEAGVDAAIALALTDVADVAQTAERLANLIRRLRGSENNAPPVPARSAATVIPWIDRLLSGGRRARTRTLALLAGADLAGALRPFQTWEAKYAARIARAEAIERETTIDRGPEPEQVGRVIAGLERAKETLPPAIRLADWLHDAEVLAEAKHELFHRAATRLLAALPEDRGPVIRAHFVEHASRVVLNADGEKTAWLWEALAAELSAGAPARLLDLWSKVFDGRLDAWLEYHLLLPFHRQADVRRFAAALARLAREAPFAYEQARGLADAVAAGLDAERAAALTRRLDPLGTHPSERLVRAGIALVGPDVDALVAPVRAMHVACGELEDEIEDALGALCEHAAATGGAWVLGGLLTRDGRRATEMAELARFVPRRLWPALGGAATRPAWIAAYPEPLAEALARLATIDPDAERTARRRTAPELVDRAALAREAAALRARVPLRPRQARRLANLEARIAAPRPPTGARMKHLAAKLDTAAIEIGAARLEAALAEAARQRLRDRLGVDAPSGWTADRMRRSILLALIDLDPAQRALARRLVQARSGPPPWDLRDDPANRAFLSRLRQQGVDPTPWLDDHTRVVTGADGQPMELGFCPDPLEVFAMGAHFSTCLSPGGDNFFSVVTNAADVNKRVLYARREGKVIGRCLLALTDAGHLLTFEPYAHDNRVGFDVEVGRFAVDLAARMGSHVAGSGQVTLLLGRDWYDDGVRDIVGRFAPLEDPAFAKALLAVPLSGAIALISKTVGRALDDLTLPVVMGAPALEQRPELIGLLAPMLLARPTLPDHTFIRAGELATRAGDPDLADRLLIGPAARAALQHDAWTWGQVLARRRPSLALARLRQTRRRGVRGWNDERGARLAVAALAMEQLRRPRQAAVLYRRALADEPALQNEIGPRLAALDGAGRT